MGLKSGLRFGNRTTVVACVTIGADLVVQCVLANFVMIVVFKYGFGNTVFKKF